MLKKMHNAYSFRYGQSNCILKFGKFGVKVMSFNRISHEQLDSIQWVLFKRLKLLSNTKKSFKFWNLIFLNSTITKLSLESRMGKGKGAIYTQTFFLKPGMIIFEFDNISYRQMSDVFQFIKKRLPFKIDLIKAL